VGVEGAVGGVAGDFAALGAPAGEGDGDDDVVMLAGAVGAEADVAGGVGGGSEIGELAQKRRHEFQVRSDFELAVFEGELEGGEEVAFGHVPGFAGAALLVAAGNVDGENIAVEAGGAEHIDDGRTDAGGVDGKRSVAGELVMLDDFADAIDYARVRGSEGHAFDMQEAEGVEGWALVRAESNEPLEHGDGGGIVFLAEIDSDEPGAHRSRAFREGSMAPSMRSRLK
jgi:hypothetical protein